MKLCATFSTDLDRAKAPRNTVGVILKFVSLRRGARISIPQRRKDGIGGRLWNMPDGEGSRDWSIREANASSNIFTAVRGAAPASKCANERRLIPCEPRIRRHC